LIDIKPSFIALIIGLSSMFILCYDNSKRGQIMSLCNKKIVSTSYKFVLISSSLILSSILSFSKEKLSFMITSIIVEMNCMLL